MSASFARRTALAAAALPLVLAGCTEDEPVPQSPDPTTPTSSASATETTAAAPVEPTLPPEARGTGMQGAEAFVRHYFAMVNYAQATGDTKGLKPLGLVSCLACTGGLESIDKIYKRGGTNEGGQYTVVSTRTTGRRIGGPNPHYYVTVVTSMTRQEISGAGDQNAVYTGGRAKWFFHLVDNPYGWQVADWNSP